MNSYKGLSTNEVIDYRNKFGTNKITEFKKNTLFSLIIESLNDPIIKILLIVLGIKILFFLHDSDIYETIGIIIAIILATIISSLSEYASEKAFEKLSSNASEIIVKVIRNGKVEDISINDIVVNDLLIVQSGDVISSDASIIEGTLSINESMLTGESKEVYKNVSDKVYRGTIVNEGYAIVKVEKVGINTFYGSIAKNVQEKSPVSPLKERLKVLASFISKIGYIGAILVIISYMFNVLVIKNNFNIDLIIKSIKDINYLLPNLLYALTLGITIIVVAVPEGLPMMITLVLSSNMKKLIKNNVLVRKLVGIETSGSLNILFTDKTGTLTAGKLSMISFITYDERKYDKFYQVDDSIKELVYLSLVYNNESIIINGKATLGNTTDQAIIKYVDTSNRDKYKIIKRERFNSKLKYSSVTVNYNNKTTFYKGAAELIISKCKFYYKNSSERGVINKDLNRLVNNYTLKGYRVLAIASGNESFDNLTFIGLILIKDEIRKEAKEGIEMVSKAGVQTVMITGDNELTARSIATEIGLINNSDDIVLTHDKLSDMTDEEIKNILPKIKVISRSLPEDKRRLVLLSQEKGLVTGMTGDGVNDAPALKRSDVAFAMGSGAEVAKEVSDIIILDDNFLSIAKTILFGRTIFKNIRKFIIFQLSVNMITMSISVIGPLIGIASPLEVVQMLWINMIMDTLAGVAYAFEAPLSSYMEEKPKRRNEKIMNSYMINEILVTGSFMGIFCLFFLKSNILKNIYRVDITNKYFMTGFFALFIFMNVFNAFNARTHRLNIFSNLLKNKVFLLVILFIVIVQFIMIYFGGNIFRTTGLTLFEMDVTILLSFLVVPFDFIRKIILKKLNKPLGV